MEYHHDTTEAQRDSSFQGMVSFYRNHPDAQLLTPWDLGEMAKVSERLQSLALRRLKDPQDESLTKEADEERIRFAMYYHRRMGELPEDQRLAFAQQFFRNLDVQWQQTAHTGTAQDFPPQVLTEIRGRQLTALHAMLSIPPPGVESPAPPASPILRVTGDTRELIVNDQSYLLPQPASGEEASWPGRPLADNLPKGSA